MDKTLENVVEECLGKWNSDVASDERLAYFCDNFEKWISQIPLQYHSVVLTLVRNLEYYSHKATNQWLSLTPCSVAVHQKILRFTPMKLLRI